MAKQGKGGKTKSSTAKTAKAKASKKGAPASSKQKNDGNAKQKKRKSGGDFWDLAADELETELGAIGLRIKDIEGDGNCLFRSIADQVSGDDGDHKSLREQTVAHMKSNPNDFSPFVEDDEEFDDYLERMAQDGEWGGNLELQALSVLLGADIYVHQSGQPAWVITNHQQQQESKRGRGKGGKGRLPLHVSYHCGDHYNSVRLKDDHSTGSPSPILLNVQQREPTSPSNQSSCTAEEEEAREQQNTSGDEAGAGDSPDRQGDCTGEHAEPADEEEAEEAGATNDREQPKGNGDKKAARKELGRNRRCPCGSKQKYKSCCGAPGRQQQPQQQRQEEEDGEADSGSLSGSLRALAI